MSLGEECTEDIVDELESRGYVVIDGEEYSEVIGQIKAWKNGE